MAARREAITSTCPHCEWWVTTGSYPKAVKAYQDHLRAEHPAVWVRE
ncbi:hypothetical protein [Halococcus sp. IIIV-5B]|nr:hypothetical protein [Halococcus sp. IIIV-5B]